MRKLGKTQKAVLRSLQQHGSWYRGCGWVWDTPSNTERLLDSLVKRGQATKREHSNSDGWTWPIYEPVRTKEYFRSQFTKKVFLAAHQPSHSKHDEWLTEAYNVLGAAEYGRLYKEAIED